MKKGIKYKIRRIIFLYIPTILLWVGLFILGCIKAGIYVI